MACHLKTPIFKSKIFKDRKIVKNLVLKALYYFLLFSPFLFTKKCNGEKKYRLSEVAGLAWFGFFRASKLGDGAWPGLVWLRK